MKIIKIENCAECPYKHTWKDNFKLTRNNCSIKTKSISGEADLIMRDIKDINIIPKWCPLLEEEQKFKKIWNEFIYNLAHVNTKTYYPDKKMTDLERINQIVKKLEEEYHIIE